MIMSHLKTQHALLHERLGRKSQEILTEKLGDNPAMD